jgi:hypothetical protein
MQTNTKIQELLFNLQNGFHLTHWNGLHDELYISRKVGEQNRVEKKGVGLPPSIIKSLVKDGVLVETLVAPHTKRYTLSSTVMSEN